MTPEMSTDPATPEGPQSAPEAPTAWQRLRRMAAPRATKANVLVAALIVFLGDQLGVGSQLSTGVVVVLGIRIFSNAAAIRRHLFRA